MTEEGIKDDFQRKNEIAMRKRKQGRARELVSHLGGRGGCC